MKLEERLALNKYDVDREVHITVDERVCKECVIKSCLYICPAQCFVMREGQDNVTFSYEGCLECGSCRIICDNGAINWIYPRGGLGIAYQYG